MPKRIRLKPQRVRSRETDKGQKRSRDPVTLASQIELVPVADLKLPPRRLRSQSGNQINELLAVIRSVGFIVPIVIDEENFIWAGRLRLEVAKRLKLLKVPTVRLQALSAAQKRAFRIADNKLPEKGKWDRKELALELPELKPLLIAEGLDISITGFSAVELDQIKIDFEQGIPEPDDDVHPDLLAQPVVSRKGDIFRLGEHVLGCGDARDEEFVRRLMGNHKASMAFLDFPFNLAVRSIGGRGAVKHPEFVMASGEMSSEQYKIFLKQAMSTAAAVSLETAIHYGCTDWRHVDALFEAGREVYDAILNLAVWVKSNAGQGSFYRSQHELVGIFRVGSEPHLNNIQLGRHGRSRSNVWNYGGVNAFRADRLSDLRSHPTVKPIAMVSDAMKDCTRLDDIVLDTFCGSGTTLLAAERVGRRAVGVEIEPRYIDVTIRRWQRLTGKDAIHTGEGCTFDALASKRRAS